MSHLWLRDAQGEWGCHPLEGELVQLAPRGPRALPARESLGSDTGPVLARGETRMTGGERWALLCAPGTRVRVNGARVCVGLLMLLDRDAIALGDGRTVFFSSERAAQMTSFPGEAHETFCIRCKLPLAPGTPAVRCPGRGCGFWHHESEDQPCWSYSKGCAGCGHPTAFDAPFQWTPQEL